MRIVICDYQRMLAEALASALGARGYPVLAVTTTVTDLLGAVGAFRPEICMLGLESGDQPSGLDAVRAIRQRYPGTMVLVLSEVADPQTLSQIMASGVMGFIHKDHSVDQIASALDEIAAGRNVVDPGPMQVPTRDRVSPRVLSPREKEIVARIVGGQSTRQMSFAMNITADTVRTHVKHVLAKLGAHSRLQLAALASRDGLLIGQQPAGNVLPLTGEQISWSRHRTPLEEGTRDGRRRW
jgi:two-component system, NarL family, nitrate/nitrite response regulator NarL